MDESFPWLFEVVGFLLVDGLTPLVQIKTLIFAGGIGGLFSALVSTR